MRTSALLVVPAFAAVALSQTGNNPALSYLSQTNSLGVPTGQPLPVTTQPVAVTTQPVAVTTQPKAATVAAAGPNTTLVAVPSAAGTGAKPVSTHTGTSGNNGTFTVSSPTSTGTSGSSTGSGSGSSTSSGSTSSSTGKSGAGFLEPALGLGLAGLLFAAFL